MGVSASIVPTKGTLPSDVDPYETEEPPGRNLRCLLGFHDWRGGVLNMRCGCTWNRCRRCHKPQSRSDRRVAEFHRHQHTREAPE